MTSSVRHLSPAASRAHLPVASTSTSASTDPAPTLLLPRHSASSNSNYPWLQGYTKSGSSTLEGGYQVFVVEQRVTDRDAYPCIVVFTGEKSDTIPVDHFVYTGPPESQKATFDASRKLLKATGARLTGQTSSENHFVPLTSLPSLPTTLTLIQIPPGDDYGSIRRLLYLNINLRRLGFGGRASLRLIPAPAAQQLHFRQCYRLPIPTPSSHHHEASGADFDTLVLDFIKLVQHALALFGLGVVEVQTPTGVSATGEWNGMQGESEYRLKEGDGLLCDTTLTALTLFRVDIAEPLLHLPSDHTVLSPSLLSSLLSLVISSRGKLLALGGSSVPKDPFTRRSKFLAALHVFQVAHRIPPSPYLCIPLLVTLRTLHARIRPSIGKRLDDSLNLPINLPRRTHKKRGEDIETSSLETLVEAFESGIGGPTVANVWGVVLRRKLRDRIRDDSETSGEEERKEKREKERLGPSVVISEPSSSSGKQSHRASFDTAAESIGRSTASFAHRLSLALSSDRENPHPRLPPSTLSSTLSSPIIGNGNSIGLGPPPPSRRTSTRRVASEAVSASTNTSPDLGSGSWEVDDSAIPVVERRVHTQTLRGRRRHSFDVVGDAPEPWQNLSRKRLEMDVNLRMTAWLLKGKEKKLEEMAEALKVVHASYTSAVQSLETPLAEKQASFDKLALTAGLLAAKVEAYQSSTSPIAQLKTGYSRLDYAQNVLEDKMTDLTEFQSSLVQKVGPRGTLDLGIGRLEHERSGMRSALRSLKMWSDWLGFLGRRIKWHMFFRWNQSEGEEVERFKAE
ncbi:hypothetical protein MNV49_005656 [Pseudohyphozyma bogoriensis]|nr:hypothetical protein MNV49_005656 [Pseudohyphozyma bogoriensis]